MLVEIDGKSLEVEDGFDVEKFEMLLVNLEMLGYDVEYEWTTIYGGQHTGVFLWEIMINNLNFVDVSFNFMNNITHFSILTDLRYYLYEKGDIREREYIVDRNEFGKVVEVICQKIGMVTVK